MVESHFGQFVSQIDQAGKKSIDASVELGQKISTFKFIFAPLKSVSTTIMLRKNFLSEIEILALFQIYNYEANITICLEQKKFA